MLWLFLGGCLFLLGNIQYCCQQAATATSVLKRMPNQASVKGTLHQRLNLHYLFFSLACFDGLRLCTGVSHWNWRPRLLRFSLSFFFSKILFFFYWKIDPSKKKVKSLFLREVATIATATMLGGNMLLSVVLFGKKISSVTKVHSKRKKIVWLKATLFLNNHEIYPHPTPPPSSSPRHSSLANLFHQGISLIFFFLKIEKNKNKKTRGLIKLRST